MVLDHCGYGIRRLLLSFHHADVQINSTYERQCRPEIQQKCPDIKRLAFTVLRPKADTTDPRSQHTVLLEPRLRPQNSSEHTSSAALASEPRLDRYSRQDDSDDLNSICANGWTLNQKQEAELEGALINIAIDHQLARSIFFPFLMITSHQEKPAHPVSKSFPAPHSCTETFQIS